ncbi:Sec63-domain-containing protein [Gloeopeniophorella convolvens]|nr:Sec63-domain-containing protein [Gloeopeniophorella convolvens]
MISEELFDMIGYDYMDMIVEILDSRSSIAEELGAALKEQSQPVTERHDGSGDGVGLTHADAKRRMEENFRQNAARPLFTRPAEATPEALPHVYTSSAAQGSVLSQFGQKFALPVGTTRHVEDYYEEVVIPPAKSIPPRATERLVPISELDDLAKQSFPGYATLNRMQSIIYPTAYGSNENMLGKTDIAMLTILRVLEQHRSHVRGESLRASIRRDDFKIIYVAPMKALAAEIVRKFAKRLQWLDIRVRELTGDMQLTKAEIAATQIIVTTPEKWDVVTRKPTGEGEIASKLKLLIIDEVHLLNDERGAVIETIVARTLRQVESSQSVIRIVGLSATLPNYIDVADFLSVSRQTGLFYFDSSFRPVPLEQHFIGVKGKPGSPHSKMNLDRVTFEKVSELVREGHQVMVFVHARKETVKAALAIRETAAHDSVLHEFSCEDHPSYGHFRRDISTSRNKEMKRLFDDGFGIHHAGMLRSDRNMMEKLFNAKAIKVLCCTATLAWGVNLPAHAVLIKGTQVYDSSKGSFVDLSVLDVLQVFGRAGRPGFETSGEGYICTSEDKLQHYLDAVTSQTPIESQFVKGMVDAMNAEIALGTVATVKDAITWLGYTYLYVRMRKSPTIYGVSYDELQNDHILGAKRRQLVLAAARNLVGARMINFDEDNGSFTITDLGRIAARYYIHHKSIEIFNNEFRGRMTEADVLAMVSLSTEFDQIQVRDNETKELMQLLDNAPCAVKEADDSVVFTRQGKINVLLQGYISWAFVEDFALVSDMQYVAQNAGRIVRALLDIAVSRKWANTSAVLMGMNKAIEKRLWPFEQPLKQFELKQDVFYGLDRWADDYSPSQLAAMSAAELGELVHLNPIHGEAILNAAKQFPAVRITYSLRPLGPDVLRIEAHVRRAFTWSSKHGSTEPCWLWVEDHEGENILQLSHLLLRQSTDVLDVAFVISIPEGRPPPFVTIRFVSERWMGAEDEIQVSFEHLIMPISSNSHTPRIDLPFLSLSVLQNPILKELFATKMRFFNALQSQAFWSTVNTSGNALVCAPAASGKSTLGYILACEVLARTTSPGYVLVVAPRQSITAEWGSELRAVLAVMGFSISLATHSDILAPATRTEIRLTTPARLMTTLSKEKDLPLSFPGMRLVILENLEQLDPFYELVVSSLRRVIQTQPTRIVGLSSSLNDSADLASWLEVAPSGFHSFRPSDRDQSLNVVAHTFTIPHSGALFKAMTKPASAAILSVHNGPAIVFVPSRAQCFPVAMDLITWCTLETGSENGYLSPDVPVESLGPYLHKLQDPRLSDLLSKGVGLFHPGLHPQDRATVLELYAQGAIRVLLAVRDACWMLPVRAAVVVVMGTQYFTVHGDGASHQLHDYSLEELVRMQGRAVRHGEAGHFHMFCQAEDKDTYMRFLEGGLPLESRLLGSDQLRLWYKHHREKGLIRNKEEGVRALSLTFLSRRIVSNPTYYDAKGNRSESLSRVVDDLEESITADRPDDQPAASRSMAHEQR